MSSKWQKRDDGFDLRIEGYHLVLTRSGQGWWWTIFTDRGGEYGEGYASTLEKANLAQELLTMESADRNQNTYLVFLSAMLERFI